MPKTESLGPLAWRARDTCFWNLVVTACLARRPSPLHRQEVLTFSCVFPSAAQSILQKERIQQTICREVVWGPNFPFFSFLLLLVHIYGLLERSMGSMFNHISSIVSPITHIRDYVANKYLWESLGIEIMVLINHSFNTCLLSGH